MIEADAWAAWMRQRGAVEVEVDPGTGRVRRLVLSPLDPSAAVPERKQAPPPRDLTYAASQPGRVR
jgi:hypothetical protein